MWHPSLVKRPEDRLKRRWGDMVFPGVMNACESWTIKKASVKELIFLHCGVGEGSIESPLDYKENQFHPKGNQSWILIGRTDAEAETLTLWPPDAKNWRIGKDPDAGKDWRWEEKGTSEDEMNGITDLGMWISLNSRSWWGTGRPGVLQSMVLRRVGHDRATEMNWSELWWLYDSPTEIKTCWQSISPMNIVIHRRMNNENSA